MKFAPGHRLSHYVIANVVGEGLLGVVYRVHRSPPDGEELALKLVRPELALDSVLLHRFIAEVRETVGCGEGRDNQIIVDHHHAQVLEDHPELQNTALVVTSLFDSSLADRLAGGPLSIDDALDIARTIAWGLECLHDRGIVHRSVKPTNILFGRDGVKLADCGWGLLVADAPTLQVEPAVARYQSPEQCRSAAAVDEHTDIYALGCVLFEMLCDRPPFDGSTVEIVEAHLTVPAPRVQTFRPDVPATIDDVVAMMLAKRMAQRPRAGALIRLLVAPYAPTGVERALFDAVRARSDDPARLVYADWLEQQGHEARATYLRREPTAPEGELLQIATGIDARWRAAVARPPVSRCGITFGTGCAMRWNALGRTDNDRIRTCEMCEKPVHFCTTLEEARIHGARRECIAIDRAVVHHDASRAEILEDFLHEYDSAAGLGENVPDDPPAPAPDVPDWAPVFPEEVEPPPPGLFDRVRRWFRR